MKNEHNPKTISECKPGEYFLHGDVIVFCEKSLPKDFDSMSEVKDACLAYGELTNHEHKLFGKEFDLRECQKTKVKYLKVFSPTALKHEEHSPIVIPPGEYKIGIQTEYDPFTKRSRQVMD